MLLSEWAWAMIEVCLTDAQGINLLNFRVDSDEEGIHYHNGEHPCIRTPQEWVDEVIREIQTIVKNYKPKHWANLHQVESNAGTRNHFIRPADGLRCVNLIDFSTGKALVYTLAQYYGMKDKSGVRIGRI